jgi:hypothetical protein
MDKPNMLYYYLKKVRLSLDDIPYRGPAARVAERQTDLCFRVDNAYRTWSGPREPNHLPCKNPEKHQHAALVSFVLLHSNSVDYLYGP